MKKDRIALVGFRATGKSLIGERLARSLGWAFVDMDDALVATFGQSIREWVDRFGWDAFRDEEAALLERLAEERHRVVATGGGVVLRASNRERLRARFSVVWLRAGLETILERLSGDAKTAGYRPPLTGLSREAEVVALLEERGPLYEGTADVVLDTDGLPPGEIVSRILTRLGAPKDG